MRQNVTTPDQGQQNYFAGDERAMLLKERSATIAALDDTASTKDWNKVMGDLTAQYGAGLERLDSYSKHVLQASLSLYLCWLHKLTEQRVPIPETLINEAIDQADPDCWSNDRDIDRHICAIAALHPQYIEHLLVVLTNQLSESAVGEGRVIP
jgi:hypothetical protein